MNILPKKKWHVRTKENVARVRRDEKRAAEEEKQVQERAHLAENEFKVNLLRRNADERMERMYGVKRAGEDVIENNASFSGHVNFFSELEADERKNLGSGNPEYEAEKRKEREEYEKKVGILQYLGQGSRELTKEIPWYEKISRGKDGKKKPERPKSTLKHCCLPEKLPEVNRKKIKKKEKKQKNKKKNRRRHDSDCTEISVSSGEYQREKNAQIEELRRKRLERESKERQKTADLLAPKKEETTEAQHGKKPKYSSQFNPELARQNRFR